MRVTITSDFSKLKQRLTNLQQKQLPFANALALTKTAEAAKRGAIKQMDKDLDRPTPFTRKGITLRKATKKGQSAVIFIKDIQAKYLKYQIEGGSRQAMQGSPVLVPNDSLRLNKYGNIARNRFRSVTAKRTQFVKNGIIYKRNKKSIRPLAGFFKSAEYSKRYKYYERLTNEARVNYPREFDKALKYALRTAR